MASYRSRDPPVTFRRRDPLTNIYNDSPSVPEWPFISILSSNSFLSIANHMFLYREPFLLLNTKATNSSGQQTPDTQSLRSQRSRGIPDPAVFGR